MLGVNTYNEETADTTRATQYLQPQSLLGRVLVRCLDQEVVPALAQTMHIYPALPNFRM